MASDKLLLEIFFVLEAPHLEEGRFHEAHQVLDGSFLLGTLRPTQLHPDAHLQHGVGEDRIPFRHLTISPPLQGYGFRPVEHAQQRNTTPAVKMLGQVADQTLHGLVLYHTDADGLGVLQARSKEVDPARRSIEEFNVYLPEIVLAELPWQTLETDQGFYSFRPQGSHQGAYRAVLPPW